MTTKSLLLTFALLLGFALAGCADDCGDIYCSPCGPSVTFRIVEAGTGAVITDVTITNSQNDLLNTGCPSGGSDGGVGPCTVGTYLGAGTVTFGISSPGHGTVTTTVKIPPAGAGCCACPFVETPVDIALPRL